MSSILFGMRLFFAAPRVASAIAAAIQTVTARRNNMPPFTTTFTLEQIRDVSAYVVEALAGRAAQ
jgi:mono/diheme cytochrome c family protein